MMKEISAVRLMKSVEKLFERICWTRSVTKYLNGRKYQIGTQQKINTLQFQKKMQYKYIRKIATAN